MKPTPRPVLPQVSPNPADPDYRVPRSLWAYCAVCGGRIALASGYIALAHLPATVRALLQAAGWQTAPTVKCPLCINKKSSS
jgi:hypothetical protein